jgi:ribonuclease E
VAAGEELELELLETHLHHPDDAIGRLDGYVISVAGAAGRVGETVKARVERATRTVAYAVLADQPAEVAAPLDAGTLVEQEDAEAGVAPVRKPSRSSGRSRRKPAAERAGDAQSAAEESGDGAEPAADAEEVETTAPAKKRTRRGTRGGRGRKRTGTGAAVEAKPEEAAVEASAADEPEDAGEAQVEAPPEAGAAETPPKKKTRRGTRGGARKKTTTATAQKDADRPSGEDAEPAAAIGPEASEHADEPEAENGAAHPKKRTRRGTRGGRGRKKPSAAANGASAEGSPAVSPEAESDTTVPEASSSEAAEDGSGEGAEEVKRTRTRRGSRGGRGRRKPPQEAVAADADAG